MLFTDVLVAAGLSFLEVTLVEGSPGVGMLSGTGALVLNGLSVTLTGG